MDAPPTYEESSKPPQGVYITGMYQDPSGKSAYPKQPVNPGYVPPPQVTNPCGGFPQTGWDTARRLTSSEYCADLAFMCGVASVIFAFIAFIMQIIQYVEHVNSPGAANAGFWAGINLAIAGIILIVSKFVPTVKVVSAVFWNSVINFFISAIGLIVPLVIYFVTKDDYWEDWWWFPAVAIQLENAKEYSNLTIAGMCGAGMLVMIVAHLNAAKALGKWCFKGGACSQQQATVPTVA